ncbi:MAG: SPFH domain-containing protein, partial [Ketobacter sp.]
MRLNYPLDLGKAPFFKGVRQVPQGSKWVVERLGKYDRTLMPGLQFTIPYIEAV